MTKRMFKLMAGTAMVLSPAEVFAQQFEADPNAIIVTAQRRDQVVTEVPIAIDVIEGDDLRERGAVSLIDVAQYTPGVDIRGPFGDNGYPLISIRGVNTDGFVESISQSTGVYSDGVFVSSPPMLALRILDLERMEVLKGPQGTLYGRNTIAGAVNFISKKPKFSPEGYATIGFGRYNKLTAEAAYGGPLSDTVAARAAVKYVRQWDSPLENEFPGLGDGGEVDQLFGRVSLAYEPTDATSVNLEVHLGRDHSDVWPFALIPAGEDSDGDGTLDRLCSDFVNGNIFAAQKNCFSADAFGSGALYNDTDGDPYTNNLNAVGQNRSESIGFSVEIKHDFGSMVLTSLTGYDNFERRDEVDEDAGPLSVLGTLRNSDVEQFSQELRLGASSGADIQWLVGLYYSWDELAGDPAFTNASGRSDFNELKTETYAAFGQVEFPLTDRLTGTVGGRWTWVDRSIYYQTSAGAPFIAQPLKDGTSNNFKDDDYSFKVALDYDLTDDVMVYASISRGFNAGTFNSQFINSLTALEPTESESILAYEAGVKAGFAGGDGYFEAAGFYYDYNDIQLVAVEPNDTIASNRLINASGAELYGFEAQLRGSPTNWLDGNIGVSYVESKLDSVPVQVSGTGAGSPFPYNAPVFGATTIDLKGNSLPNTPKWSVNGSARFHQPLGDSWDGYIQTDVLWQDEIARDLLGTPALFTKAHWNLDARIGVESTDGLWNFSIWGKNLTDELYLTEAYEVLGFGYYIGAGTFNYPRTYGVTLTRNF